MSGYARAAAALGASVSGADRAESRYTRRLRSEGVLDAQVGHDAANVAAGEDVEVVYSSAIAPESPERVAARERGLPERSRAQLLGELSALRRTIAVAGAHGKTTTSSMIVSVLRIAGLDPGWLVGSPVGEGLDNSHWSEGEWLVVEADESDRSMLSLDVEIAVLTNVELDHHATFGSLAQLREDYAAFLARARSAIVVWDRPDLLALTRRSNDSEPSSPIRGSARVPPFEPASAVGATGPPTNVQVVAYDVAQPTLTRGGSSFQWRGLEVRLAVPGAHNTLNAVAALEAARLVGVEEPASAIEGFRGAARRFERLGRTRAGAVVIDDYAHHPTELAATIQAARTLEHRRLVAVFQPHLYSRTAALADEFGAALALADVAVVLDVYGARESARDHPGVSGLTVARAVSERSAGHPAYWLPSFERACAVLERLLEADDLCLVMGAGDVEELAQRLVCRQLGPATPRPSRERAS
jgi:UDP-N-acetylmuramate--alanine ligase